MRDRERMTACPEDGRECFLQDTATLKTELRCRLMSVLCRRYFQIKKEPHLKGKVNDRAVVKAPINFNLHLITRAALAQFTK